jgi:hypothetical protein
MKMSGGKGYSYGEKGMAMAKKAPAKSGKSMMMTKAKKKKK